MYLLNGTMARLLRPARTESASLRRVSAPSGNVDLARRTFLVGAVLGPLVGVSPAARGRAIVAAPSREIEFDLVYKNKRIGEYVVTRTKAANQVRVVTRINAKVEVAFFTAFEHRHDCEEVWDERGLVTFESETLERGVRLQTGGERVDDAFKIVGPAGPYLVPIGTLTTDSIWTPTITEHEELIDVQHGGVVGLVAKRLGQETVQAAGRATLAEKVRIITPFARGNAWYDGDGEWVGAALEERGNVIELRRV